MTLPAFTDEFSGVHPRLGHHTPSLLEEIGALDIVPSFHIPYLHGMETSDSRPKNEYEKPESGSPSGHPPVNRRACIAVSIVPSSS